jgi:transposase-like protein
MTYSLDFRRKALSVREQEGLTIAEVAARLGVGIASVVLWLKKVEPQRTRNKPATKIDMGALAQDVRDFPRRLSVRTRPTAGGQPERNRSRPAAFGRDL